MSFQIPPGVVDQIRSEVFNFVLNPKPRIQSWFSGLQPGSFEITGNLTSEYNCIAWAAEDTDRWWWPVPPGVWYWPDGVPEEETLEAFVQAYATLGYVPCDIACDEKRYENIAIYVTRRQTLTRGKATIERAMDKQAWSLGKNRTRLQCAGGKRPERIRPDYPDNETTKKKNLAGRYWLAIRFRQTLKKRMAVTDGP